MDEGLVPAMPPSVTVQNECGKTILLRPSPSSFETFYWQSGPMGTSTAISEAMLERTVAAILYLRSRYNGNGNWGPAREVVYTVDSCSGQGGEFSNENYVATRIYLEPLSSPDSITSSEQVIESVTYFDGLGRPMQQVGKRAGGTGQDLVTHMGYDQYGRQSKEHLPVPMADNLHGVYRSGDMQTLAGPFYGGLFPEDFSGMTGYNGLS